MNREQVFEWVMEFILEHEGDYVDDDQDPGGETNFGISSVYHPDADVENLTRQEAVEIYREHYWKQYRLNELPPAWGMLVMDAVVNQPADFAIKAFQKAVGTVQDGIIGPKTIGAAQACRSPYHLEAFCLERLQRYISRSHFPRFGNGWMRRVLQCYHEARQNIRSA